MSHDNSSPSFLDDSDDEDDDGDSVMIGVAMTVSIPHHQPIRGDIPTYTLNAAYGRNRADGSKRKIMVRPAL